MGELLTTIRHEVGHAVSAFLLEATEDAGPISIVPGRGFHGISFPGRAPGFSRREPSRGRLWVQLPAETQRVIQVSAMVRLAGEVAEDVWADLLQPSRGAAVAEDARPAAAPAAPGRPELPERELALLHSAAVSGDGRSDWNLYFNLMADSHDQDEDAALAHLEFLRQEVRKLLCTDRAIRMGRALRRELMIRRTLPAEGWLRLLAAVPDEA